MPSVNMPSYNTPSPHLPYYSLLEDYIMDSSESTYSSSEPCYSPEVAPSPALSAVSLESSYPHARSAYEQQRHDDKLRSSLKLGNLPLNLSALPLLFPKARARKNGELVRYSIKHLISLAIRGSPRQALTLSQIYTAVEENLDSYQPAPGETARERTKRVQWQSSVRHSLSLQCMFERVEHLPGDNDKKRRGAYWTLDPFQYGKSRRTLLKEKKKATGVVEHKRRRSSSTKRSPRARPRSRARISPSPSPEPQPPQLRPLASSDGHIPQLHGSGSLVNYAHLPGPLMTHPRGLHDLPPMDLPCLHPLPSLFTLMSSDSPQAVVYQDSMLDSYLQYSHNGQYQQLSQYSPYESPMPMPMTTQLGYEAGQGISPSLLHAPISSQSQERPPTAVAHGRSLRSTASRQRRDALIPC